MKKIYFLALFTFSCTLNSIAQDVIRLQSCNDPLISKQADSLKSLYAKDGFTLLKETSVTMESDYEMPVIVPLTEGVWYQFVFIGEYTSRLYEVRMFDWTEKQVVLQQKRKGEVEGNIIAYSYKPTSSTPHAFRCLQINKKKKKNLCGYVMLLKKDINTTP